jgi:uncharacterized protein (TIGR01244 family)
MDLQRIPRPLRRAGLVVGGWLGLFVVVNVLILVLGVAARWAGRDPRVDGDDGWPGVAHLRAVDDRLLVGGQPSLEDYRQLAERGVTLVVDVRSGSTVDPALDEPDELADLGLDYAKLRVPDGRAPTPGQVERFLDLVEGADGRVFAHCGGGVGRSTSLAAAYEAAQGQDPSVLEQLATGPPTIEQIWYVATLRPNRPEHAINPAVAVVSRVVDVPRQLYGWITSPVRD